MEVLVENVNSTSEWRRSLFTMFSVVISILNCYLFSEFFYVNHFFLFSLFSL